VLYITGALLLGLYFTLQAVRFQRARCVKHARRVLRASLVYLPGLLLVLLADRSLTLFL
jgi:heme O synthase-like polyprenyltransferase